MAITDLPIFCELAPEECEQLVSLARERHLPAGERLASDELSERVIFVLSGEVAVEQQGRSERLAEAPAVIGLLAALDAERSMMLLCARTDAELLVIERSALKQRMAESAALGAAVVLHLTHELHVERQIRRRMLLGVDELLGSPGARLPGGPYTGAADALAFVVRGQGVRRLLPSALRAIPSLSDSFVLLFDFFEQISCTGSGATHPFSFNSAAILVPCLSSTVRPSFFCPELYADNFLAITLGRELHGLPERYGNIVRGDRHVDLVLGGRIVARASWRGVREIDAANMIARGLGSMAPAGPLSSAFSGLLGRTFGLIRMRPAANQWPRVPLLVARPALAGTSESRSDGVAEVSLRLSRYEGFRSLSAPKIDWFDPGYFVSGECSAGFVLRASFELGSGSTAAESAGGKSPGSRRATAK